MPELPEVETIKNQITTFLPLNIKKVTYSKVHKSILKIKEFSPKTKTIGKIDRKGKLLIFYLTDEINILSHLGMSGSWRISDTPITAKHTHILFECTNEKNKIVYLGYVDPRRFGNMYFLKQKNTFVHLNKIGVDISTKQFDQKYLISIFNKFPNKMLKPFLLDQKYFAGCGNYIASEICALSGILPTRLCREITKRECTKMIKATSMVLSKSIKNNGLTFSGGYLDAFGKKGMGVLNLVVFNQKKCGLCKKVEVTKVELAGRGTYFCNKCQH